MRAPKTFAAALLTVAMAATACGGGGANAGGTGGAGGSGGGLKGSGSGGACKIDKAVPVAAVFSLTGAAAAYGKTQKNGVELAAEELGKKDGVKYDLKVEDDATDPKQGITVFEKLVKNKTSVIIGPTLSNAAKQTNPVAQDGKTPVLGVSNTAAGITEIGDFIWRDSLTEDAVIPQTVAQVKKTYSPKKAVVMYSNDDAFTEAGFKVMEASLKKEGLEIVKVIKFSKADTDFRTLLNDAKAQNPDVLVVSALIEAAVPLVTQAREVGITKPIVGGNGFNSPQLMKGAGKAAEDVVVGAAWNSASKSPENDAFLAAYKAKYGSDPDQFAAQAYAGMKLVDAAVRNGCSGEPKAIRDSFGQLKDIPTALGSFSFDTKRDAVHPAVVQIVKDGKFDVLK